MVKNLPSPDCRLGYTDSQVSAIVGARLKEFNFWMAGQTMAICDGRQYNFATEEYEPDDCGPHGVVVYPWDLERFLDGRPILD
jgi:hypothetical protein